MRRRDGLVMCRLKSRSCYCVSRGYGLRERRAHKTQTTGPLVVVGVLCAGREAVEFGWRDGLEISEDIAEL